MLKSEKVGSFITGANLVADGGFSATSILKEIGGGDARLDHDNVIHGYARDPP